MEELRSTEILDKEIQSDARKKAENILKKAESDCQDIINSVTTEVEKAKQTKSDFYNKKLALIQKDQDASIPLEKQRFVVSFVQEAIIKNLNKYLSSLKEEERVELIFSQFDENILKGKKLNAFVYGFDVKKISAILSKKLGAGLLKCEKTDFNRIVYEEELGLENKEGIILETENKDFRLRLTLTQIVTSLLANHRAQLSDALFGEGGLE